MFNRLFGYKKKEDPKVIEKKPTIIVVKPGVKEAVIDIRQETKPVQAPKIVVEFPAVPKVTTTPLQTPLKILQIFDDRMRDDEALSDYPPIATPLGEKYSAYSKQYLCESKASIESLEDAVKLYEFEIGRRTNIGSICLRLEEELLKTKDQDKVPSDPELLTFYHSVKTPVTSITDYIKHFEEHSKASETAFTMMFIILNIVTNEQFFKFSLPKKERITCQAPVVFNPLTSHRLVLTCLLVAFKWIDDHASVHAHRKKHAEANKIFADLGGITGKLKEIYNLERTLLDSLDYRLPFQPIYFDDALKAINLMPVTDQYTLFRKHNQLDEEKKSQDWPVLRFKKSL